MNTTDKNAIGTPVADTDQVQSESANWLETFSILVHDIESPLVSIKYVLRLLNEGKLDLGKELHRQLVASSQIAVERAESIIYDIMAVARAGEAGLTASMETLQPAPIIEEAILLAKASAIESDLKMTYIDKADSSPVRADQKLLKRMIDNLLFNAVRHTPSGGTIAVYTEVGRESLFIHIKDSGPGLKEADPELLFEKYGQIRLRGQGRHRGVGLGLYFCRLAATAMGGTIVADDHPQGGAVFSIRLKKAEE